MPSPSGYYQPTTDEPVRHCIDFSGVSDDVIINLPDSIKNFREFRFNEKRKRISFLVARLQFYKSYFQQSVIDYDPQSAKFEALFLAYNPQLDFKSLQFYSFIDTSDETYSFSDLYRFKRFKIIGAIADTTNTVVNTATNSFQLVMYGGAGLLLYSLYKKTNSKRAVSFSTIKERR